MRIQRLDENTKKNLLEDLLKRSPNQYPEYEKRVGDILEEVRENRDKAVFAFTKKFDGADISAETIVVTEEEIKEAENGAKKLGCKFCKCVPYTISDLPDKRFLVIYKKISSTPALYPRNFSQISKKPL